MSRKSTRILPKPGCTSKSNDLVSHQKVPQEKNQNPLACRLCGHLFISEIRLFAHMFMHEDGTSKTRCRFQEDKRNHPPRDRPFKCDTCESSFSQEKTLQMHLLSHKSETFSCETCLAVFPTLGSLQKHTLVTHADDPTKKGKKKPVPKKNPKKPRILRESEYPKKQESVPDQSDKDIVDVNDIRKRCLMHVDRRMFCCEHCGKLFSIENNFKKHLLAHDYTRKTLHRRPWYVKKIDPLETSGSEQFQCIKQEETKDDSLEERPWDVQNIVKEETGEDGLEKRPRYVKNEGETEEDCLEKRPVKKIVKQEAEEDSLENENGEFLDVEPLLECELRDCKPRHRKRDNEVSPDKSYICEICQKTFSQNSYLRNHLSTHLSKKKHICEICKRVFLRKQNLARHLLTHTGNLYASALNK